MLWSTFQQMKVLEKAWNIVYYTDSHSLDITYMGQIESFVNLQLIDVVINCAAYTNVEQAEEDILNYQVNTLWVYNLAKICAEKNIKLIHISTDYVFDGSKKEWYLTDTPVWPLNKYGIAKWLGEQSLLSFCPTAKTVRTSRLYGWGKEFKNFVNTMMTLWKTKSELSIINDQWWAPTWTNDLVAAIYTLLIQWDNYTDMIFHFCNQTEQWWITRFNFAQEIFNQQCINIDLNPIASIQYQTKAKRPTYSRMINTSDIQLPHWKKSLFLYLDNL